MSLPVRDFIIQRLLEFDPNFDVGSGVPTTGLMIDPQSVILQPIVDELTVVQASQSILSILETDDPDSFPEDIVDGLASNAFVDRKPGEIGSDVERVRFFEPQDFQAKQGILIFRGSGGQRYTNADPVDITAAEMALHQEGTLYYADVPIIALEEGDSFNVAKGGITTMEAEPVGVANVTNLFGIDQGRNRETNTELIARIKVAVTVRALVTGRGIIVTLTENFTTIEEIQPIGFGQPEMMRDIVYNVHIGGNVDVYVKNPAFRESSADFFGLEVDTTRRKRTSTAVTLLTESVEYSLDRANIDPSVFAPTVTDIDGGLPFVSGLDYSINDATGTITRLPGSGIFHLAGGAATVTSTKRLNKPGAFGSVGAGMSLTIDTPAEVAGSYTVKKRISADEIEIYGEFGAAAAVAVGYAFDQVVAVTFDYNPITVDIITTARTGRSAFTITDVPLMYIESVEVLDPLSGDPTGVVLSGIGGYGAGGYGDGGYGVGAGVDYAFVVTNPTLRHSQREDNYIEFSSSFAGVSVRVNYQYASAIPAIQAFMDDRDNQSETASLLARHFIPVFVDSTKAISYDIAANTATTAITVDDMTTLIKQFVDDVDEGKPLEISDLVDTLYNNGADHVDIGSVKSLRGEIHNHDGSIVFTLPNDAGDLAIPNDPITDPSDHPLSPRIARFRSRNITLTRNVV